MRHSVLFSADTIVAPATPPGAGGIAIVRLSGPKAMELLHQVFSPTCRTATLVPRHLYHGHLCDYVRQVTLDEVLAVVMPGPHSYTGEDVAEIHCHGGPLVVRSIIDVLVELGCRLAHPGEFTQRAFVNGRIDLSRAEAIADLIQARTSGAMQIALAQLGGRLQLEVESYRSVLTELLSFVELHIDFSDEDIDHPDFSQVRLSGVTLSTRMAQLLAGFDQGRVLREGVSVLIVGRPNVGKSSLLNALLGESRAIVTDIPGTTRDTIEEQVVIGGLPLRLVDTAGIRETFDPVEAEGVRRARERLASADLVLLVIDSSQPLTSDDHLAMSACGDRRVIVALSKADLPQHGHDLALFPGPVVELSVHSGAGLDTLRQQISSTFLATSEATQESFFLADRRHREAVLRAHAALTRFLAGLDDNSAAEFLSADLRDALSAIGEVTGETTPDEILHLIFSRFCIGK